MFQVGDEFLGLLEHRNQGYKLVIIDKSKCDYKVRWEHCYTKKNLGTWKADDLFIQDWIDRGNISSRINAKTLDDCM